MASIRANARKIICVGRNYADHITELNNQRPKQPFFFLKPPSSILPPGGGPLLIPRGTRAHYEVELALIMGRTVRDLPEETSDAEALEGVSGYCLAIDMTARNVQDEAKRKGLPWSIAKGFDTFLPVSEALAKSAVPDPYAARLALSVNGQLRQNDTCDLMLFRIPTLLSHISRCMTLEPGDVVLTGTPKGVGEIRPGDSMRAWLEVGGSEVATIDVKAEEKGGIYQFAET